MRFMMLYKPGRDGGGPPNPDAMARLNKLIADEQSVGKFLATDGLKSSAHGARVRINNGVISVVDGPFAEVKELIGGYAIFDLSSKEEAIESTKRFLEIMGEGETEIREMYEPSDFAPPGVEQGAAAGAKR